MSHYQHLVEQLKQLRLEDCRTLWKCGSRKPKNDNWPTSTF